MQQDRAVMTRPVVGDPRYDLVLDQLISSITERPIISAGGWITQAGKLYISSPYIYGLKARLGCMKRRFTRSLFLFFFSSMVLTWGNDYEQKNMLLYKSGRGPATSESFEGSSMCQLDRTQATTQYLEEIKSQFNNLYLIAGLMLVALLGDAINESRSSVPHVACNEGRV
jgi:hypothetical protein